MAARGRSASDSDAAEAEQLYELLEREVIPEFYSRDGDGIPRAWVARVRASMASLAPQFSSNRMMRDYVERHYLPAASAFRRRSGDGARLARDVQSWVDQLERHWGAVRFGAVEVSHDGERRRYEVEVHLGSISPEMIRVEVYADPVDGEEPARYELAAGRGNSRGGERIRVPGKRSAVVSAALTPRIIPHHPEARIPLEAPYIVWPE